MAREGEFAARSAITGQRWCPSALSMMAKEGSRRLDADTICGEQGSGSYTETAVRLVRSHPTLPCMYCLRGAEVIGKITIGI